MHRVHEWLESLAAEESEEGRPTKRLCHGLDQPPSPLIPKTASLQEVMSHIADGADCCCDVSHINQTFYRPVRKSLITVSIETKPEVPQNDPLLQLGIWTTAWHSRMYILRPSAGLNPGARLVSLPLIQAVGHVWRIYFACDMGTRIDLLWPYDYRQYREHYINLRSTFFPPEHQSMD
ncbi:hypothetical protein GQX73_g10462 [Xylaria multiplex]|uniref:PD-(D/E)XK nuclease-like domain-containing protein n=1 Tax=Xylaria multiplex TaxID=323545 RepID=A0A7C8MQM9_9PEZI|nr:hypothetical protein GQX73_g10462 [Xylaria multiplex]